MAVFSKRSKLSGILREVVFDEYTQDEFNALYSQYEKDNDIEIFDLLSDTSKQFVKTGIVDEEWEQYVVSFGHDF